MNTVYLPMNSVEAVHFPISSKNTFKNFFKNLYVLIFWLYYYIVYKSKDKFFKK